MAIAVIETVWPSGVRLLISMRIRPSRCSVRRHTLSGFDSPTSVSVITSASVSTRPARRTAAPSSPSLATTPRPSRGSLSAEWPLKSFVTIVSADLSASSSYSCPARRSAARLALLMPSPAMNCRR